VDARSKYHEDLIDPVEKLDIYKTYDKKQIIKTKSHKNKEDIIKQLNKKLGVYEMYGKKKTPTHKKQKTVRRKFTF